MKTIEREICCPMTTLILLSLVLGWFIYDYTSYEYKTCKISNIVSKCTPILRSYSCEYAITVISKCGNITDVVNRQQDNDRDMIINNSDAPCANSQVCDVMIGDRLERHNLTIIAIIV